MRDRTLTYLLLGALLVLLGVPVLATVTLPYTFSPGTPIRSAEVNANFAALADAAGRLETGKQAAITNSPCDAGQFVRGVGANGALECGVDQVGAGGDAGVSSLNGRTGSLSLQAGDNVAVETSAAGVITVSAASGTGPAGPPGPPGEPGPAGPQGQVGPQGAQGIVATWFITGTPREPQLGNYLYDFAATPQRLTVGSGQKVFAIASMSARALSGQWGARWAICTRAMDTLVRTPHGSLFGWFGDPTQNGSLTANALVTLTPGTYDIGPCLAVEQTGRLNYNSGSYTTLMLLND
jgi:hypothetical protein